MRTGRSDRRLSALPLAAALLLAALLAGCAASPASRLDDAQTLAARAGWQASRLPAGRFELLALHAPPRPAAELAIFIEGDGLAWLDRRTPSTDPTPRNPVGLRLALAEPYRPSAWLARPCQYSASLARCSVDDWTGARFSNEIVAAMNDAVSQLKQRFGAERLLLVGYSGGGTIAALVAARRDDVARLVTIAAVLDHEAWTRQQAVTPLAGSLNPASSWAALLGLRQQHLVGGADRQTGRAAIEPYVARFPASSRPEVIELPGYGHACCWAEDWARISPLMSPLAKP